MPMLEYKLEDGQSIWIEVKPQEYTRREAKSRAPHLEPGFLDIIKANVRLLRKKIDELEVFERPREVEVEMHLKFNAEAGVWGLALTGLESGYVVKLKWVHEPDQPKPEEKAKP